MQDQSSASHAHGAERWRAVPGHEGYYEVSDLGRVRSLRLRSRNQHGATSEKIRPQPLILQPGRQQNGYLAITIAGVRRGIHRLVLEAFVGPSRPEQQAAHLNGRRDDNRLVNLQWKTPIQNAADRELHGTVLRGDRSPSRLHPERLPRGERHPAARLTAEKVLAIRAAARDGATYGAIARRFGINSGTAHDVVQGRTWAHIDWAPPPQRTPPTHCPNGHLYDEANTAYWSSGRRVCRACRRARFHEVKGRWRPRGRADAASAER